MEHETRVKGSSVMLSELCDRLDTLWTAYLRHLEEYTTAQRLVQKHMSAGFFSLARANFTAREGVRRYGKDFYHENAVASRRIQLASAEPNDRPRLSTVIWSPPTSEDEQDERDAEKTDPAIVEPNQQPSPPPTPAASPGQDDLSSAVEEDTVNLKRNDRDEKASSQPSEKLPLAMEPLRWFGILISPDLRAVQNSFTPAIEVAVSQAANSARAMRETEVEIRKVRKDIKRTEKAATKA